MLVPYSKQLKSWFLEEFHPNRLLPTIIISLVSEVIAVIFALSLAALIFSGSLSHYVYAGVRIALFSTIVIRTIVALTSSFPSIIADLDERPLVILALAVASMSDSMITSATGEEIFSTVACAIALTSLLTGTFLLILGVLKVGEMIRFIPYPVIGGFLASTGWLLVQGSFQVMTDTPLGFSQLPLLFQSSVMLRWLPGLIFAVLLLVILRRHTHFLVVPVSLLTAVGLFHGLLWLTHTSIAEATTQGWLLQPFPDSELWQPLSFLALTQVNWSVIFHQIGGITTIMLVSAASTLLNASGIELTTEQDIDLNRELQAAGIANLVSGLGGGMIGFHSLSDSVLVYKMGGRSRLVGLLSAVFCAVLLVLGPSLISFFPKSVLGGLLLLFGLSFLTEWVCDAWFKLSWSEYFIVLLILIVTGTAGSLLGMGVGLIAAVILFIINYSRINVVKHVSSGANRRSRVVRAVNRDRLKREGEQIYILDLQGYIFFGNANGLLNQIHQRINDSSLSPLRFVILNFSLVNGLDSSAVASLVKIKRIACNYQLSLVLTNLQPTLQKQLRQGRFVKDAFCQIFPELYQGVEWCENQIIKTIPVRIRRWKQYKKCEDIR